ncbi:MAG TPA: DinB family protein [Gemmatimonadales bacterium]|nr:DinB family protein [Gemmatimonadales bacterium]
MTSFANPAAGAAAAAPAYVRALLDLLGPRDPLDVLPELVPWLESRLRDVPAAVLRRPEGPGKWSVVAVLQHLADSEMVLGVRGRLVLSEDRPAIQGFDQDRWAELFRYREASAGQAMAQLSALRAGNLALWRSLGPAELGRAGRHSERGEESLGLMLRLMAAHDLVHRAQVERVLRAAGRGSRVEGRGSNTPEVLDPGP